MKIKWMFIENKEKIVEFINRCTTWDPKWMANYDELMINRDGDVYRVKYVELGKSNVGQFVRTHDSDEIKVLPDGMVLGAKVTWTRPSLDFKRRGVDFDKIITKYADRVEIREY